MKDFALFFFLLFGCASAFSQFVVDSVHTSVQYQGSGEWLLSNVEYRFYDADCRLTRNEVHMPDNETFEWGLFTFNEYTYNSSSELFDVVESFIVDGDEDDPILLLEYDYDDAGIQSRLVQSLWDEEELSWNLYSLDTNVIVDDKIVASHSFWRDMENSTWDNSYKTEQSFIGDQLTTQDRYNWINGGWVLSSVNQYTYTNGLLTTVVNQVWNEIFAEWEDMRIDEYTYDENDLLVELTWTYVGQQLPIYKYEYYHSEGCTTGIDDYQADNNALQLYPNPAETELNINFSGETNYDLSVFNLIGEEVMRHADLNSNATIDLSGLESGVYTVHALGEGKDAFKRIMVK